MFIALEECLVDYDCHVEFGDIMLGLQMEDVFPKRRHGVTSRNT